MSDEFSNLKGFYKLSAKERADKIKELCGLEQSEINLLSKGGIGVEEASNMVENVIGSFNLPMGIATNFRINGRDYLIPMCTEEPSVIAAASNSAKAARMKGGFTTASSDPIMIGQIQVVGIRDMGEAVGSIVEMRKELLEIANEQDPVLCTYGGGARDIEIREIETRFGPMLVVHLLVDCRDAMGANTVNTMCEALAPVIEELTQGQVLLRILSNLASHRMVEAKAVFPHDALGTSELSGEEVVDRIISAQIFAESDPFRAATHNKGVMNGVDAVVRATGNDTRAIEAGYHAYCTLDGGYVPLTRYEKNADGDLVGNLRMPMAVGLVGGATAVHPSAKTAIKILGVKSASELGEVICCVGLAQNFGALRALATVGIQKGHMRLHARNIAVMAGAGPDIIDEVVTRLVAGGKVQMHIAQEIIEELKKG